MQPFSSNSLPPQFQTNAANPSLSQQQVFTPYPLQTNPSNMLQNSAPTQPHQQMGLINPQIPIMQSSLMMQGFANSPSQLGIPQLGATGFGHQHGALNINTLPMVSAVGQLRNFLQNQVNPSQPQVQLMHNLANLPQNMGLPNGQFGVPNLNQLMAMQAQMQMQMQMQMPNPSHVIPQGFLPGSQQAMGCPNPALFVNPQFGQQQMNQNLQNMVPNAMNVNGSNRLPIAAQQAQGHSGAVPPTQSQSMQANGLPRSQEKPMKNPQMNTSNSKWKNSPSKNFNNNSKREASKWGFQKSQPHNDNAKRKFGFPNGRRNRGRGNERGAKYGLANSTEQPREKKRSLALTYTEEEIQQWREERRKNYPSASNIEKKLREDVTTSEVISRDAKIRREQLKEILEKQAELGVEVAEIPSYYLSDLGAQVHRREENQQPMDRKARFQNKHGGRRKYDKNDRFIKKQRLEGKDTSNISSYNKRKPTLLEKLLSADIRRDKRRLLQVFRFMVMNSYFKDGPGKPLEFPLVVVKENGCKDKVVEEISTLVKHDASADRGNDNNEVDGRDDSEGSNDDYDNVDDRGDDNGDDIEVEKEVNFVAGNGNSREETEEEGEIID